MAFKIGDSHSARTYMKQLTKKSTWLLSEIIIIGWQDRKKRDGTQFKSYSIIAQLGRRLKSGIIKSYQRVIPIGSTKYGNDTEWSRLCVAIGGPDSFMKEGQQWDLNKICGDLQDDVWANSYNLVIEIGPNIPMKNYKSGEPRTPKNHFYGLITIAKIKDEFQTRKDLDEHLTYSDWCVKEFGDVIKAQSRLPVYVPIVETIDEDIPDITCDTAELAELEELMADFSVKKGGI